GGGRCARGGRGARRPARAAGRGAEDVPHAPDRMDERLAVFVEFAAEGTDVDLDEVEVVVLGAPHLGEELDLREDDAGVLGEGRQQREFPVGQVDHLPGPHGAVGLRVDDQVLDLEDAATDTAPAPEHRLHADQQFGHHEGLDHVVVAADVEAGQHVFDAGGGGEEDEGNVLGGPEPAGDGDPVDAVSEVEVDQGDVRKVRRHGPLDAAAGDRGLHVVAGPLPRS